MVCGNYEGVIGYAKAKAETGQSAMQKVIPHYHFSSRMNGEDYTFYVVSTLCTYVTYGRISL